MLLNNDFLISERDDEHRPTALRPAHHLRYNQDLWRAGQNHVLVSGRRDLTSCISRRKIKETYLKISTNGWKLEGFARVGAHSLPADVLNYSKMIYINL